MWKLTFKYISMVFWSCPFSFLLTVVSWLGFSRNKGLNFFNSLCWGHFTLSRMCTISFLAWMIRATFYRRKKYKSLLPEACGWQRKNSATSSLLFTLLRLEQSSIIYFLEYILKSSKVSKFRNITSSYVFFTHHVFLL